MTARERLLTALRGGIPDMVPVSPLVHERYAYEVLGRTGVEAWCEVHRRLGSSHHRGGATLTIPSKLPEGWAKSQQEEKLPSGETVIRTRLQTPSGTLTSTTRRGFLAHDPTLTKVTEYLVKGPEDWGIHESYLEQRLAGLGEPDWSSYLAADEMVGDEGVIAAYLPASFCSLMDVRGMEQILFDLYDCPERLCAVLELQRAVDRRTIEAFVASPAPVGYMDICWATGAQMGPKLFAEWVLPDVVTAAEAFRVAPEKCFGLYTLGKMRDLLPMLVEAGVNFIETFEPNEGDISLTEVKQRYGDRICLVGNFDCVILAFGTREQARAEARRCLCEGMEGGGYVLATADEVPTDAQWDNLRALVEITQEYGRYE